MMLSEDYLMRTVKAMAAAVARVLRLARGGDFVGARQEIDGVYSGQLGFSREQLDRLDAATVVRMLGVDRAEALVSVVLAEAEVFRAEGHADRAVACQHRALDLDAHIRTERRAPDGRSEDPRP